jgi:hypothetical protein
MSMNTLRALSMMSALMAATAVSADNYSAYSNTAMSITGDIELDDFEILFEGGEKLEFSDLVASSFIVDGEHVSASVYEVASPDDPVLMNGNRLCGMGDVTYVANWGSGDGLTTVAVFTGDVAPESSDEMCASYTYGE